MHWKSSLRVFGLGEGLSIGMIGLATIEETSSKTGSGSNRMGSSGGVFSKIRSRSSSPSAVVLCVKDPPVAVSSCRADSLLRPNQKCYRSTWFGIDKSGPDLLRL